MTELILCGALSKTTYKVYASSSKLPIMFNTADEVNFRSKALLLDFLGMHKQKSSYRGEISFLGLVSSLCLIPAGWRSIIVLLSIEVYNYCKVFLITFQYKELEICMKNKIVVLTITIMLVLSSVLVGCSSKDESSPKEAEAAEAAGASSEEQAPVETPAMEAEESSPSNSPQAEIFDTNFVIKEGELKDYVGEGGDVAIPYGITRIGCAAFMDCVGLTSITIPDSVTYIEFGAFAGCTNLTSVTIPNSVTEMEFNTFNGCSSLSNITLPDDITYISDQMFAYCTSLTSITIPDGVTRIGQGAFAGCTSLQSITIPDSVTTIDFKAFYKCRNLTNGTIPDSVTTIGEDAFYNCPLKP